MRIFLNFLIGLILGFSLSFAYADSNLEEIEQNISDSVITTKITAKFTQNSDLNPLKISVSTTNGVVTLSGDVINKIAFIDALKIAKQTKGVKTVIVSKLIIRQVNTSFTDAYITAKVEAAVLAAKVLDDESIPIVGINASTSNGTVTLTGKVQQQKSIVAIIKRVHDVDGVKKIISNLQVKKDV
ncbi:MAG: BON domain-containing protein [Tatlockia sp.]|nr:BON domain-containing protein [Tatlockia sp.]